MSNTEPGPDETTETEATETPAPEGDSELGNLTVEDDPQGTVDPSDLAGTASADDEDVS